MKKTKLLIMSCILGTSLLASNSMVFAKADAVYTKDVSGNIFQYDLKALSHDAVRHELGLLTPLYDEYLTRTVVAFHDDKTGYIDSAKIQDAATKSALNNTTFSIDTYTEAASGDAIVAPTYPIHVRGSQDGKTVVDERIITDPNTNTATPIVDMTTLTLDTITLPFTTIASFKVTNITSGDIAANYTVTVKGKIATYDAKTGLFKASVDGTLEVKHFQSADFVITKGTSTNTNTNTAMIDISSVACDNPVDNFSTIVTFKINITTSLDSAANYDVAVKGKKATYKETTRSFEVTVDGKVAATDLSASDFVITKK